MMDRFHGAYELWIMLNGEWLWLSNAPTLVTCLIEMRMASASMRLPLDLFSCGLVL